MYIYIFSMPSPIDALRQKRDLVLRDLQAIDHLRRGCLSQQFFKAAPGQKSRRGPYFILQGFFRGQKFNERIPAEQAEQVREQVDNYRRFQSLAEQCVTLSDEITRLESSEGDSKKNSRPRRSPRSNFRKPPPS